MVSFIVRVLMSLESNGVLRFRGLTSQSVFRCLCPGALEVQWLPSFSRPDVSWCPSLFVSCRGLTSHGVLGCLCPDVPEVHGVLRLRVLTSHGVLRCLCPDVPEIKSRVASSCPDVSWCPSLFVS